MNKSNQGARRGALGFGLKAKPGSREGSEGSEGSEGGKAKTVFSFKFSVFRWKQNGGNHEIHGPHEMTAPEGNGGNDNRGQELERRRGRLGADSSRRRRANVERIFNLNLKTAERGFTAKYAKYAKAAGTNGKPRRIYDSTIQRFNDLLFPPPSPICHLLTSILKIEWQNLAPEWRRVKIRLLSIPDRLNMEALC